MSIPPSLTITHHHSPSLTIMNILITDNNGSYLGVYKTSMEEVERDTELYRSQEEDSFLFLPVMVDGKRYHYHTRVEGPEGGEFILQMKDGQFGNAELANSFNVLKSKCKKFLYQVFS